MKSEREEELESRIGALERRVQILNYFLYQYALNFNHLRPVGNNSLIANTFLSAQEVTLEALSGLHQFIGILTNETQALQREKTQGDTLSVWNRESETVRRELELLPEHLMETAKQESQAKISEKQVRVREISEKTHEAKETYEKAKGERERLTEARRAVGAKLFGESK